MGHLSTYSAVTSRSKWPKNDILAESEPVEVALLNVCSWYFNWKAEERARVKRWWNIKGKGIRTGLAEVSRWQTPVMLLFLEYSCLCLASPPEVFLHLSLFFFFSCSFLYSSKIAELQCEPWPWQWWGELIANPEDRIHPNVTAEAGNALHSQLDTFPLLFYVVCINKHCSILLFFSPNSMYLTPGADQPFFHVAGHQQFVVLL